MLYRKKVPEIEAIRVTRSNLEEIRGFTGDHCNIIIEKCPGGHVNIQIPTRSGGLLPVTVGDYIVRDPVDGFNVIPEKAFESIYEPVE